MMVPAGRADAASARGRGAADPVTRDPASGLMVTLGSEGEGRLLLTDADGAPAGTIEPPPGYRLSHLVEAGDRLLVVGLGEAAVDGWPDWHFEIDARARAPPPRRPGLLRRRQRLVDRRRQRLGAVGLEDDRAAAGARAWRSRRYSRW